MFQLAFEERAKVVTNCDYLDKYKFSKSMPYAFTEFDAFALANVLASNQAIEVGLQNSLWHCHAPGL
jgi:hypothetical protein